jgi:Mn-dependent DtxR family transcriptional regulator
MQTEREVRTMKAKSLEHLSTKAINKLSDGGIYDTKKYRYIVNRSDGEVYRIEKDLLGTTETLDPENWIKQ